MFKWLKSRKFQCDITEEQFFNFIKTPKDTYGNISKQTKHYLDYFNKYKATNKIMNWNYSAAFGAVGWLIFRKMYLYALGIANLERMIGRIIVKPLKSSGASEILVTISDFSTEIILFILLGLFGDYLYLNFAVN